MDELGIRIGLKQTEDMARRGGIGRALVQQDAGRGQATQFLKHIADRPLHAIHQPLLGLRHGLFGLTAEFQLRQRAQQPVTKRAVQLLVRRLIGPVMDRIADKHVQFGNTHNARVLAKTAAEHRRKALGKGENKKRLRHIIASRLRLDLVHTNLIIHILPVCEQSHRLHPKVSVL